MVIGLLIGLAVTKGVLDTTKKLKTKRKRKKKGVPQF